MLLRVTTEVAIIKAVYKNRSGFTILELLIVIVVIGILAGIVLVAFGNIQERAESSRTKAAALQYSKALFSYKTDNESYPDIQSLGGGFASDQRVCLGTGYEDSQCGASSGWVNESSTFNTWMNPYISDAPDIRATTFSTNFGGGPLQVRGLWLSQFLGSFAGSSLDGVADEDFWTISYILASPQETCNAGGEVLNTVDFSNYTTGGAQDYTLSTSDVTYCVVLLP